jgi:hypothetical protein
MSPGIVVFSCFRIPLPLIFILLTLFYACDVPRDNPLDPGGSNYNPPIPVLSSEECQVSIYSSHIKQWYPTNDIYVLYISAVLNVPLSVEWVRAIYSDSIFYTLDSELKTTIYEAYLPNSNIYSIVGHPFYLEINLNNGSVYHSEDFWLARVIDYIPQPLSPANDETTGVRPILTWEPADLNFPFTYTLTVHKYPMPQVFWYYEGIPSNVNYFQVDTDLIIGQNYWQVSVVDEFGNQSTSPEAFFIVTNEASP